jgi:hypothetical protein
MSELKIIPMRCPACGANLQVSADMENFACSYCGTQLTAERKGGTVALKPIIDAIARLQVETDKNAAELAIIRLTADLEQLERQSQIRRRTGQGALDQQRVVIYQQQKNPNNLFIPAIPASFVLVLVTALLEPRPVPAESSLADTLAFLGGLLAAAICYALAFIVIRRMRNRETDRLNAGLAAAQAQYQRDIAADDQQLQALRQKISEKKRIADS